MYNVMKGKTIVRSNQLSKQSGVVSIFIVIFSALLVTIVTVSFVSLMIRNQQQASDADLSNSAYDAAMAGVEDAKRLMLIYRSCGSTDMTPRCENARAGMIKVAGTDETKCNSTRNGLYGLDDDQKTMIQSSESGDAASAVLNQAYTCVKIKYDTDVVPGVIKQDETEIIPLDTDGQPFTSITLSWFMRKAGETKNLSFYNDIAGQYPLPPKASWLPTNSSTQILAPIMRTQFIQVGDSFSLADFDGDVNGGSNTNTLFLYPKSAGVNASFPANDTRPTVQDSSKMPVATRCNVATYASNGYACTTTIDVGFPVGGGNRKIAYLRISPLYANTDTNYQIQLKNNTSTVKFVGVRPRVDSTGQANSLFRRVQATVAFDSDFAYPKATVDINGNLCKDFRVTDKTSDYQSSCNP